jgi:HD-like signal output (HDOD) protein
MRRFIRQKNPGETEPSWAVGMRFSKVDEFVTDEGLPSLPGQILNILDELSHSSALDYTILQKIQYDPAIALSVLKAANSQLYGYASKISSLQQAAGLVGPGTIKNIILTTPILERYQDNGGFHSSLDHSKLWLHMTVTAALASGLGRCIRYSETDVCFTAGLIHGVGKIALSAYRPQSLLDSMQLAKREQVSLIEIEKRILGFTHVDVGVSLVETYGLPDQLINVLKNCYASENDEISDLLSGVVCLARNLANSWGFEDGIYDGALLGRNKLLSLLNISGKDLEEWTPLLRKNVDLAVQALG